MSDDKVIAKISENFVPVALNLYVIREAKTDGGEFWRDVQKQKPEQYQGIFVVNSEGKVLSSQGRQPEKPKTWAGDLLDVLTEGLKAHGAVTPRKVTATEPQPHRGVGEHKDGVTLAVTMRWTLFGVEKRGLSTPAFDSVSLTPSQVMSLGLADSPKGATWQVPGAVVKQLHKVLSATSDKGTLPRANEVTVAELKGKVESVSNGIAYLSFEGKIAGSHQGEFEPNVGKRTQSEVKLTGVGTCEAKTGKLLTITLLGDGTHRGFPPYDEAQRFGSITEWKRTK